jgi:endonuclease III
MTRGDKGAATAQLLLDRYGRTYAEDAGIRLADRPAPLYQLLVLATLLSARISAGIAVAAARELFAASYRTPTAMAAATWQDRVDALGRGHYRRYDERTATMLGDGAELLTRRWRGDMRRLHAEARGQARRLRSLLTGFPGIGPAGADIFLREVQGTWPDIAPYADGRMLEAARKLGLPDRPDELARLAGEPGQFPRLAAALVRVSLTRGGVEDFLAAAGS